MVGITAACLPLYVVRYRIGPLPTTLLEGLIWVTVAASLLSLWSERRRPAARTPVRPVPDHCEGALVRRRQPFAAVRGDGPDLVPSRLWGDGSARCCSRPQCSQPAVAPRSRGSPGTGRAGGARAAFHKPAPEHAQPLRSAPALDLHQALGMLSQRPIFGAGISGFPIRVAPFRPVGQEIELYPHDL